jgi:hypothetical protein
MLPETIAQIILESIKLTRVILEGIPVAERQAIWNEHEARLARLREWLDKLSAGLHAPLPPGT